MKRVIKSIGSFKAKTHLSGLIGEFDKIRELVHGSVDINIMSEYENGAGNY